MLKLVFAALLLAGPAAAHAFLKTASPAVGSTVAAAPPEVVINFTGGVEPRFSTIAVEDAAGTAMTTGDAHLDGSDTKLVVPVKSLPPGVYRVTWHATSVDTHKTEGNFVFTVAP